MDLNFTKTEGKWVAEFQATAEEKEEFERLQTEEMGTPENI